MQLAMPLVEHPHLGRANSKTFDGAHRSLRGIEPKKGMKKLIERENFFVKIT